MNFESVYDALINSDEKNDFLIEISGRILRMSYEWCPR